MQSTLVAMRERGLFAILNKWRNEAFPVYGPNKEVLLTIEQCGSPLFGIVAYGAHALAYVLSESSSSNGTAAGGLAVGETVLEALVRECEEEAALPPSLVHKLAKPAGMVTNFCVRSDRAGVETKFLQPECHYVYDLPLSPEIICKTNDDEVEEFNLRTVGEIQNALANREFKPNCAIVMLDFFHPSWHSDT